MGTHYAWRRGDYADAAMTSLSGEVDTEYALLVATFGDPDEGHDGKTDAEWVIVYDDGAVVTVYNWKNGPSYGGPPIEDITEWNVGSKGAGDDAVARVRHAISNCYAELMDDAIEADRIV